MGLKKNLYYEIKDVIQEERQDGVHAYKQKIRTKVYGLNSSKEVRKNLIDILIDRVENHKDKVISPIIYEELLGMEIKRNGKVEHSNSTHDDQVFSWLMALYVWYEGVNLAERFGIRKVAIKTDEEIDEPIDYYNDDTVEIVGSFNQNDDLQEDIERDLEAAIKAGGIPIKEYLEKRYQEERAQFNMLVNTPAGERAYRQTYGIPKDKPISNYVNNNANGYEIPDSVFYSFYNPSDRSFELDYSSDTNVGAVPESEIASLEDDSYSYTDHFNF
jgi:hypothetical protein